MTSSNLIIALFVHDMKTPLAVIELGVKTLLKNKKTVSDLKDHDRHLLETILIKKKQAVILLNKILDLDLPEKNPITSKKSFPYRIINAVQQMAGLKKATQSLTCVADTLEKLNGVLVDILGSISTLQHRRNQRKVRRPNTETTLSRMARNAKTSILYTNNAIAIVHSHESFTGARDYKLSTIVKATMVDIFDLMDPKTSAEIQDTESLADLTALLEKNGVRLEADENQWETQYTLQGDRVRQVLVNLLMNAFKYKKTFIDFKIRYSSRQLIVSVADDGMGIPAQFHRHIFKKRFQIKSEHDFPVRGHGIGLAGSQALLNNMNGSLHLKSDVDRQTCFSARIDGVDEI